jgi:hypothetical protein
MNAQQLFITDVLVELPPKFKFVSTLKGIDVGNIASRDVSHTNSVKLLWTPTIQQLFGFAWDETAGATVVYQKLPCKLTEGGFETVADGLCWVMSVDAAGITLAVFENILDVFTSVQGRKLVELNLYAASGWNAADIDNARLNTTGILHAICHFGKPNGANIFNVNFWLPCFFYHDWVKGCLRTTGLNLSGAILTDPNFTNLVVPYSFEKWAYPVGLNRIYELNNPFAFLSFNFSGVTTTDGVTNFQADVCSLGGGSTATWQVVGGELELKDTGHGTQRWLSLTMTQLAFNVDINTWAPGDVLHIIVEIYHPTLGYSYGFDCTADEAILGPSPVFGGCGPASPTLLATIGDGARIRARIDGAATPAGIILNAGCNAGGPSGAVPTAIDRTSVVWNLLMPDVNQIDILKDFSMRFGVLFKQIRDTLYLKTLKEIIQDTAGAVNWTNKRATGPGKEDAIVFSSSRYGKRTNFRYTEDSGAGEEPDNTAGMGTIALDNDQLNAESDYYDSPFECSKDVFLQVTALADKVYDATSTTIDDFKKTPGLRLGVIRSKLGGEPTMTFNAVARGDYKVVNFIYEASVGIQTASWAYYLANYYAEMGSAMQRLRIITRWYNLTEQDIATFDRFKMIHDRASYFLVDRIENFTPGTPTKVTLFKVI